MQSQAQNDYASFDAKRFGCPPWNGARGLPWRRFKNDFIIYLGTIEIKDNADEFGLDDEILGRTEGGDAAGAPAAPATAPSRRLKSKRVKRSYNLIMSHITDEALKTTVANEANYDARQAWLVCIREGEEVTTELELENQKAAVRALTIKGSVGIQDNSLSMYAREVREKNSLITIERERLTEHELALQMLNQISVVSPHLAVLADKEMKAHDGQRACVHPAGHPRAGFRSTSPRSSKSSHRYGWDGQWKDGCLCMSTS